MTEWIAMTDTQTAGAGQTAGSIPNALTIAGSDSGGGAGIQADLKAFSARGVYGASVLTAITAQNTRAVTAIHAIPLEIIEAQIHAVFDDLSIQAIKIGMLGDADTVRSVAKTLTTRGQQAPLPPIVLDPVMVAKSGDRLLALDAVTALTETLAPLATVITPNAPEAAILLGTDEAKDRDALLVQGQELVTRLGCSVLMKGGHLDGPVCSDTLITADGEIYTHESERVQTRNTHGTGCTLSSAIAAELALEFTVPEAVAKGVAYVHAAIKAAEQLTVGSGHGPVHHFHALWQNPPA